jgi:transcriptional regulator with XRE-family HTH domain
MPNLADILVEGRQRQNWSQADLAFRAGVSGSTVSRLEQGRGKANVNSLRRLAAAIGFDADALIAMAKNPAKQVQPAWLTETGGPALSLASIPGLFTADRLAQRRHSSMPVMQAPPGMRRVPHYGGVSAVRADRREEPAADFSSVPDIGVDFTVRVDGQCMEPRYDDGERVGCSIRRWEREGFVWGKDYWIRFSDGETTLKRVRPDPRNRDKFVCVPLNPKSKPFSRGKSEVEKAARVLVVLSG